VRAVGAVPGIRRLRFTSPHPNDFTDRVIAALAEVDAVCEHVHLPMQSGSDRVLKRMLRRYTREGYLDCVAKLRAAIPGMSVTTDVIVGFPGETEEDFRATLDVVAAARFAQAFTFQYSTRPGTPAAELPDQVPKDVVADRYRRLVELQEEISWRENAAQEGGEVEVLVAEGEGRKDGATRRMSGRARDNRLVHFALPPAGPRPRPGDMVTVAVTHGAPHHLVADSARTGGTFAVRPTPAGDAWQRRAEGSAEARTQAGREQGSPGPVRLGLPTLRPV